MLNQVGLRPARAWSAKYHASHTRAVSSPRIHLGPEFHADASFWRLLVERGLGSPAGRLTAPMYRSFMQPPTFTLWSDASGDATGGIILAPSSGPACSGVLSLTTMCALDCMQRLGTGTICRLMCSSCWVWF